MKPNPVPTAAPADVSHTCAEPVTRLLRPLLNLIAATLLVVLAARAATSLGLLPAPLPIFDYDRTVLAHKAWLAQHGPAADLLILGDSSALMNLSATQLGRALALPRGALNLATFSLLGVDDHALLLKHYLEHHAAPPRQVLLYLHPRSLRNIARSELHSRWLSDLLVGRDLESSRDLSGALGRILGVEAIRQRLITRCVPVPIARSPAAELKFTRDLWTSLTERRGSAVETGTLAPGDVRGDAAYELRASLEPQARAVRRLLPEGCELVVALAPLPESFALRAWPEDAAALTRQWQVWTGAARALDALPAVLPDRHFSSLAHLAGPRQEAYTEAVASALRSAPVR